MAISDVTKADIRAGFEAGRSIKQLAAEFGVPLVSVVRATEGLRGKTAATTTRDRSAINAAR